MRGGQFVHSTALCNYISLDLNIVLKLQLSDNMSFREIESLAHSTERGRGGEDEGERERERNREGNHGG